MLPLHHDPVLGRAYAFQSWLRSCSCSSFPVVALRVELSTTRLSAVSGQPALDYHLPTSLSAQVGMAGLEPAFSCSQGTRVRRYPTSRFVQSERPDLNRRSPGPARASRDNQASLRSARSSPYGSRTRLRRLEGAASCPIDERAISAPPHAVDTSGQRAPFTQWAGRCSNPRLRLFRPRATPSQLPAQQKKPDVVVTPGFRYSSGIYGLVSQAQWIERGYSPIDRRMYPSIFALRDLAVWKSWLFLSNKQPDEGCLPVFYRTDAAQAEIVHKKS